MTGEREAAKTRARQTALPHGAEPLTADYSPHLSVPVFIERSEPLTADWSRAAGAALTDNGDLLKKCSFKSHYLRFSQ